MVSPLIVRRLLEVPYVDNSQGFMNTHSLICNNDKFYSTPQLQQYASSLNNYVISLVLGTCATISQSFRYFMTVTSRNKLITSRSKCHRRTQPHETHLNIMRLITTCSSKCHMRTQFTVDIITRNPLTNNVTSNTAGKNEHLLQILA